MCTPAREPGKMPLYEAGHHKLAGARNGRDVWKVTCRRGSREMDDGQYVVAVGSDDAGVNLKDFIRNQLRDDPRVKEIIDFGVADAEDKTAYPVICIKAAEAVARGEADRAVLFGGTGLGEAISANEMGAATMGLGVVLIALGTIGVVPVSGMFEWVTRLACPVMLVPMLLRLHLYTGGMDHHAHAA